MRFEERGAWELCNIQQLDWSSIANAPTGMEEWVIDLAALAAICGRKVVSVDVSFVIGIIMIIIYTCNSSSLDC